MQSVFWCFNGLQVWCISDGCEYFCGGLCGLVYLSGLCGLEYFSGLCMTVLFPPTGYFGVFQWNCDYGCFMGLGGIQCVNIGVV